MNRSSIDSCHESRSSPASPAWKATPGAGRSTTSATIPRQHPLNEHRTRTALESRSACAEALREETRSAMNRASYVVRGYQRDVSYKHAAPASVSNRRTHSLALRACQRLIHALLLNPQPEAQTFPERVGHSMPESWTAEEILTQRREGAESQREAAGRCSAWRPRVFEPSREVLSLRRRVIDLQVASAHRCR